MSELRAAIAADYAGGKTVAEIASAHEVSMATVYTTLHRAGSLDRRARGRVRRLDPDLAKQLPTKYREAVRLRNEGKTLVEIGDVFGVTSERIRQLLTKLIGA